MVKCQVQQEFTLGKFKELKNIVRNQENINHEKNKLYYHDIFECTIEMATYLERENDYTRKTKKSLISVIEVIPEKENIKEAKQTTKKKTTKKE